MPPDPSTCPDLTRLLGSPAARGFDRHAVIPADQLVPRPEVRALCAADRCGEHGRHHLCPPAVGTLAQCAARLHAFRHAVLVQRGYAVDVSDRAAGEATKRDLHERVLALEAAARAALWPAAWALMAGSCNLCSPCTYVQGVPCAFPARARPSLESLGVDVIALVTPLGWATAFRTDRIDWIGAVLI